jgi:TrmH family RNA methyltransferase
MIELVVILVKPKYEGNIGAVARSMMNFGFTTLTLVNPPAIDSKECRKYALHAQSILDNAKIVKCFREGIRDLDFLAGTSARIYKGEKVHPRAPVGIKEFAKRVFKVKGKVGIAFGPEDFGLSNEELAKCDLLISVPTSEQYPSMNLSHAVHLILWELFCASRAESFEHPSEISKLEKEKFFEHFCLLLEQIGYPEHKREKTRIMVRRIMGRALVSKFEYHRLMGVFQVIQNKFSKSTPF